MVPDRMQLQGMVMNEKESFKEYVQRWRELVAQVEPPLSENWEFHMGAPALENYFAFQNRVQDLIEAKVDTFTPRRPNVNTNPMPTHGGALVSAIEEINKGELIEKVELIQTPNVVIGTQLLKSGMIPIDLVDKEKVEDLKSFIQ